MITIYPINPVTKLGYKTAEDTPCTNTIVDNYIKCMENESYSVEDIFPFNKTKHFKVKPYYAANIKGIVYSVTIDSGVMRTSVTRTLNIKMNPNISYFIVMTDPKLQFISTNPKVIPRTVLKFEKNSGTVTLYLQVDNN